MNERFERRRSVIREIRELHNAVSYRLAMRGLKSGDFDSEEEATEANAPLHIDVTDEDVLKSLCETLDTVKVMREAANSNKGKWADRVVDRWLSDADDMERDARSAMGL